MRYRIFIALSLHRANHFIRKGSQVGQAPFAFGGSMCLVPSRFLVLHVHANGLRVDLLHSPLTHWGQTGNSDWPVSPLLPVLKVTFALLQSSVTSWIDMTFQK